MRLLFVLLGCLPFFAGCTSSEKIERRSPNSYSELSHGNVFSFKEDILASNISTTWYSENNFWFSVKNGEIVKGGSDRVCSFAFFIPENTQLFVPKGTTATIIESPESDVETGFWERKKNYLDVFGYRDTSTIYFEGNMQVIRGSISFRGLFTCADVNNVEKTSQSLTPIAFKKMVLDPSSGVPLKIHLD